MNKEFETKAKQDELLKTVSEKFPRVKRQPNGRIIWRLTGNTPEEDEQLGISNIQGLFLESFPEFDNLYPRDENGKIAEEKKKDAMEYIINHLGSATKFAKYFRREVFKLPYFESSYAVAIKKSFLSWGLGFEISETGKGRTLSLTKQSQEMTWSLPGNSLEENEVIGIHNIQTLFLSAFPEFNDLFPLGEDGKISENLREAAREFIFEKIGNVDDFTAHISFAPQHKESTPYFGGSIHIAIAKSFSTWGLNFPEYDKDLADKWAPINYFRRKFGLTNEAVMSLLEGVPCRKGIWNNKRIISLYDKIVLEEKIREYLSFPYSDRQNARLVDNKGEIWISLSQLKKETGISFQTLQKYLSGLTTLQGRGIKNQLSIFYKETEAMRVLNNILNLPNLDEDTGIYIDADNVRWVSAENIRRQLKIKLNFVYSQLNKMVGVQRIKARGQMRRFITLYNEKEAIESLRQSEFLKHRELGQPLSPDEANEELMKFLEIKDSS